MISFGSDPEFMLQNEQGQLKSAIEIVPGSKEERYDLKDGHAAYFDNVLAECSIRPGTSKEDAVSSFRQCFQRYAQLVAPHRLAVIASALYPEAELLHEEAQEFGCDPEFCAYVLNVIPPPLPEDAGAFRSAGGHLHIGFNGGAWFDDDDDDDDNYSAEELEELNLAVSWNSIWVARMADLFIGIPSLSLDRDPTSKDRRKLYGTAGSHRPCKAYGVEYRPLGNFWLQRPSLVELMYDLATFCVHTVMDAKQHEKIWDNLDTETLRATINTWNMDGAAQFNKIVGERLPKELNNRIKEEGEKDHNNNLYEQWEIKL